MIPLFRAWWPTLLWIVVIAMESSYGSAANTSRFLHPLMVFLFPHMTAVQFYAFHGFVRKAGHFFGYAMLSLLAYRSWWATLRRRRDHTATFAWGEIARRWAWTAALLALLTTVGVAAADEYHQTFARGRTGKVADVVLDGMGGILVQTLLIVISSASVSNRSRRPPAKVEKFTSA